MPNTLAVRRLLFKILICRLIKITRINFLIVYGDMLKSTTVKTANFCKV